MAEHARNFRDADRVDTHRDGMGRTENLTLRSGTVSRLVLQPGWRWSQHARADGAQGSCAEPHVRYVISGRMAIRMDDGTETVYETGDVQQIEPGHDGWVVGDEPVVLLDWYAATEKAQQ